MVCNQAKELSGSVGKYPSSDANDSDNDLSKHVSGEADIFTMTHSDNFSSVGKEFGSVSKVSSVTNYQRIEGQESVMPPIEVIYCFLSYNDCTSRLLTDSQSSVMEVIVCMYTSLLMKL